MVLCKLVETAARGAVESAFEPLDDVTCVGMISELLDWARVDPVLVRLADPSRTYLCGHSRARTAERASLLRTQGPVFRHVCWITCFQWEACAPQAMLVPFTVCISSVTCAA